ncbi:unnamed protein product [Clavelina lepadiformis]|uniref:JmjC domain-containing protein n=1 Tax=Clavelina lepadiformis TaxID=159417 RepID=A0ABP0GLE8_CLALP
MTENSLQITEADFHNLMERARNELEVKDEDFANLPSIKYIACGTNKWSPRPIFWISLLYFIIIAFPISCYFAVDKGTDFGKDILKSYFNIIGLETTVEEEVCAFNNMELIADPFRPPVDCSECIGITEIKRVKDLSPGDFIDNYAFTMQPILIEDGQDNWTATKAFSFEYFRNIYAHGSEALRKVEKDCQFFPYQTEFVSLGEFFNMSQNRVEGKEEPWYVGWSNCDGKAANELRKHYKIPYFLPLELDHSKTDWVFMGLPGYGAAMHIDNVETHSWQAQVKGVKKWTLQTAPECHGICTTQMEVIVKPGDIIVLNTNKWYHETEILGVETSIVIGSEYF